MKKLLIAVFLTLLFGACIDGLNYPVELGKDLKDRTVDILQRREQLDTYTLTFKDKKVGRVHAIDKVYDWGSNNDPLPNQLPTFKKVTLIFGDRVKNIQDVSRNMSSQAIKHLDNAYFNPSTYRFEITYIHDTIKSMRRNFNFPKFPIFP